MHINQVLKRKNPEFILQYIEFECNVGHASEHVLWIVTNVSRAQGMLLGLATYYTCDIKN